MTATLMSYDEALASFDPVLGLRGPRRAQHRLQDVLRLLDPLRLRAEHPGVPDLPGSSRRDARGQRQGRGFRDPHRAGAELRDRRVVPLRAEELLLPRHAQKTPRPASTTSRSRTTAGPTSRWTGHDVPNPSQQIERAHMEEDTGKSLHVGGATGRIHGADYSLVDYNRAGIPLIEIVTKPIEGTGAAAPLVAKAYVAHLRELLLGLGVSEVRVERGRCVPTSTCRWGRRPESPLGTRTEARTSTRCGRSSGPCAARAAPRRDPRGGRLGPQETRHFHEDPGHHSRAREVRRGGLPLLPRARPGPGGAGPRVGRAAAGRFPSRRGSGAPGCRPSGASPTWRCATRSAPERSGLVEQTNTAGASPQAARKWWLSEIARRANEEGVELAALGDHPGPGGRNPDVRRPGRINDKLARQVFDGVLAGEGTPDEVVGKRGLAVVSDEGALSEAVDGRSRRTRTWPTRSVTGRWPQPAPSSAR